MPQLAPILAAVSLACLTGAISYPEANAQQDDPQKTATAQALYNRASDAMDKRDYETACPLLEEVVRLIPEGVGAKLTLAECYEGSGRLASAWTRYVIAETAAGRAGQKDRSKTARDRIDALEPKLARITIVVPENVRALPGLDIHRDTISIGATQWGVPAPVDKGPHVIVVTAQGKQRLEKIVDVPTDGVTVPVEIDGLVDAKPHVSAPPPLKPSAKERPTPEQSSSGLGAQRTAGLVLVGVSVAAVGIGAFFGSRAITKLNESNDGHCIAQNLCDPAGVDLRAQALTAAKASNGLIIAGGVFAAGGLIVFATAKTARTHGAHVSLTLGRVEFRGAW